ncbi:MAG: hypothetical protein HYW07_01200 [Candidatus Latescibacteria bacterium]|nr:hypothetical protein [Candidatus Latescibacterota bacterium]
MARSSGWLGLLGLMFFIYMVPEALLAAKLELRQAGTGDTDISVEVGDEFEVELWVDAENRSISGAAIFLSFDDQVLELVDHDRPGYLPFRPGAFLRNGEIYRNTLLAADDPAAAAAGTQVDYSVVRASDQGAGSAATFRLRTKAPSPRTTIRIDESGGRETRFFTPDGAHQPFQFIAPLQIQVKGIELAGIPQRLVLARGQADTTSLQLDHFLFDPLYGPQDIQWFVSPSPALSLEFDAQTRLVRLQAPAGASLWEQLRLTATNPDGQSASAIVEVYVDAPPQLADDLGPVAFAEDQPFEWPLENLVSDPDSGPDRLQWQFEAPQELGASLGVSPRTLRFSPLPDWNGEGALTLMVADEFGFADTARVSFAVAPVADAPRFRMAPNIRLIRGRQDSSLTRQALLSDAEESPDQLELSWEGAEHVAVQEREGRLVLGASLDWTGTEEIRLRVSDGSGLSAQTPLTVSVVPSLPPALQEVPRRRGIAPGTYFVLVLDSLVVDPDDEAGNLRWQVSGQQQLSADLSGNRAVRIEASDSFAGTELLHFAVVDPSGESAGFDLLVFAASADGAPTIAPLPELSVPLGGVDTSLDLDEYLFDLDQEPSQMEWSAEAMEGVELRIDPDTHMLVVNPAIDTQSGLRQAQLRARDPDGHEALQTPLPHLIGTSGPGDPGPDSSPAPTVPVLASLPSLSIRAGQFDQSLDLDDFVSQADPATLTWEVQAPEHLSGLVDAQSHRLLVLAEAGWEGEALLILRARDALGKSVEAVLRVLVVPAEPALILRETLQVDLLEGDTEIRLPLSDLFEGREIPEGLIWEASGSQPIQISQDAGVLILKSGQPWQGNETITLQARDTQNHLASGQLTLQVYPADGSAGQEVSEFRLALLPNPLQPEYLDLFVLSDRPLSQTPRLRLQSGSNLEVIQVAPGIWQGSHVLQPGEAETLGFLALALDQDRQLLKSSLSFSK